MNHRVGIDTVSDKLKRPLQTPVRVPRKLHCKTRSSGNCSTRGKTRHRLFSWRRGTEKIQQQPSSWSGPLEAQVPTCHLPYTPETPSTARKTKTYGTDHMVSRVSGRLHYSDTERGEVVTAWDGDDRLSRASVPCDSLIELKAPEKKKKKRSSKYPSLAAR